MSETRMTTEQRRLHELAEYLWETMETLIDNRADHKVGTPGYIAHLAMYNGVHQQYVATCMQLQEMDDA